MMAVKERSVFRAVNPALLGVVLLLSVFGSVMVHSAVQGMDGGDTMFRRHLMGIAIGLVPLGVAWLIDYRKLQGWVGPLLILDAFLILAPRIPGLGATAKGAQSWLQIGGLRLFQPSEPAKLVTIVVMAAIIAQYRGSIERPRDIFKVLGVLAIPLGLILLQPDLGTGLVFVAITAGMLLIGGMSGRWFLIFALAGALLIGGGLRLDAGLDKAAGHDVFLKDYQMNRLLVFVDPTRDPAGAGYNLEQSKIAIGSGELSGKGLGSGTQGNLNFLPERHTDFIFSVLGEELGFVGGLILLALYLGLLITALGIATSSRDLYGALIVAGVISMWTFQILENVGMTIGLMPITGIPLPFMSFGSSFMVTNMAATGMLLSVWTRRYS
ncbi:MAG: rod shape-determining protein RodA [Actinobacteria bacterium HGW-Actinobacteria-7]|nr:MAG: rod shape-determining protein RodA [Actinobacteria bacterium HGW-Actinobacteria-7]